VYVLKLRVFQPSHCGILGRKSHNNNHLRQLTCSDFLNGVLRCLRNRAAMLGKRLASFLTIGIKHRWVCDIQCDNDVTAHFRLSFGFEFAI
jgi:hypothetical protein